MTPPTYPMRPLNGGRPLPAIFESRYLRDTRWYFEPKVNGWRGLLQVATGYLWNRHGQPSSLGPEFAAAITFLRALPSPFPWLDVEMMERRSPLLRGTLIILDGLPLQVPQASLVDSLMPHCERRRRLREAGLTELPHLPASDLPLPPAVMLPTYQPAALADAIQLWDALREANRTLGAELYEGVVAKRYDSPYTHQSRNASVESPHWVKHRWAF